MNLGVTHNIPLLRDIITEERFVKGETTTKYLPQVYPDGFKGKQLKDNERESLVALAACVAVKSALRDRSFRHQKSSTAAPQNYAFEVRLNEFKRHIRVTPKANDGAKEFQVEVDGKHRITINDNFHLGDKVLHVDFDGEPYTIQVSAEISTMRSLNFSGFFLLFSY